MKNPTKVILGLLVPMLVLVSVLGAIVLWMFRTTAEERMAEVREEQEAAISELLRGQVDLAMTMVEHAYAAADPDANPAEVQAAVLERVRELRFGEDDLSYIWVHHFAPGNVRRTTMLMHPVIPSLNGTDLSDYHDMERFQSIVYDGRVVATDDPEVKHIRETNLFVEMNEVCRRNGGGDVTYYWPKPLADGATPEGHQKLSYVELFAPWNWVIGTGAYVDYIDGVVAAEQEKAQRKERGIFLTFSIALVLACALGIVFSLWAGRKLGRLYAQIEEQLARNEEIGRELTARNEELENALQEVKTLSGLLPICSYCKKIRDDGGYWSQMEEYIGKRSEAQFSHGICPACVQENFPGLE